MESSYPEDETKFFDRVIDNTEEAYRALKYDKTKDWYIWITHWEAFEFYSKFKNIFGIRPNRFCGVSLFHYDAHNNIPHLSWDRQYAYDICGWEYEGYPTYFEPYNPSRPRGPREFGLLTTKSYSPLPGSPDDPDYPEYPNEPKYPKYPEDFEDCNDIK